MPLTPADVHNVAFSKPPIGKRGYAEDEVDQFLDLVEDTLGQLQDDNEALRNQVEELQAELRSGGSQASVSAPISSTVDEDALRRRIEADVEARYEAKLAEARADAERAHREAQEAKQAEAEAREAAHTARADAESSGHYHEDGAATGDTHMQAARVLGLAQEMADRLTNDAREESKVMVEEARSAATRTINEANETSRRTLGDAKDQATRTLSEANEKSALMLDEAKRRSEVILADATSQSEATVKQAEDKAHALRADADRKYSETMTTMKQQQSVYEHRIEELRVFEREYRTRLKNLLETKLEELETVNSSAPTSHGSRS